MFASDEDLFAALAVSQRLLAEREATKKGGAATTPAPRTTPLPRLTGPSSASAPPPSSGPTRSFNPQGLTLEDHPVTQLDLIEAQLDGLTVSGGSVMSRTSSGSAPFLGRMRVGQKAGVAYGRKRDVRQADRKPRNTHVVHDRKRDVHQARQRMSELKVKEIREPVVGVDCDDPSNPEYFVAKFEDQLERVMGGDKDEHMVRRMLENTNVRWKDEGVLAYLDAHPDVQSRLDATFTDVFTSQVMQPRAVKAQYESDSDSSYTMVEESNRINVVD